MAITVVHITGKVVVPGSGAGIRALVSARPQTTSGGLLFPDDNTVTWGPSTLETDEDGNLPGSGLPIPIDSSLGDAVIWTIAAKPLDRKDLQTWRIGNFQITANADLADLIPVDVTDVSETLASEVAAHAASVLAIPTTTDGLIATNIENPASLTAGALSDAIAAENATQVPPLVADALASDPTIEAAASAAAEIAVDDRVDGLDIVLGTDPGVPNEVGVIGYADADLSDADQLLRGITNGGVNHLPLARVDQLTLGDDVVVETIDETVLGYSKVTLDADDHMDEHALADDGTVPAWVLARWKDRGVFGTSGPDFYKDVVIVTAGQSLATKGAGGPTQQIPQVYDDPMVRRWDHNTSAWVVETGIEWLGSGFARQIRRDNPGVRVNVIEAAAGGAGFTTTSLNPPPAGTNYVAGVGTWDRNFLANHGEVEPLIYPTLNLGTRVSAALAALGATHDDIVALIWAQGEADSSLTNKLNQTQYSDFLVDLISYTRSQWSRPDLPWLIASMAPPLAILASPTPIDKAQQDIPRLVDYSAYEFGFWSGQENTLYRTHFLGQVQELRGANLARAPLVRARQNAVPASPNAALMAPLSLTIKRSGTAADLLWEYPPCRVLAFVVTTSQDSGGTWSSPVTLAVPVATRHALTGLTAASPLWVRVLSVGTPIGTGLAVSAAANTITKTAHGFANEQRVVLTATTATGVSVNTSYFVVGATSNTFQLALTAGGSAVDITADGTATVAPASYAIEEHA